MNIKIKSIFKLIENAILLVAAFIVVFLILSILLPKFKYNTIIIRSGSMEPTIKTGSVVLIKQNEQYSQGDIVTFVKSKNEIVTHRIIQTDQNDTLFRTKGDANNTEDTFWIRKESILGKTLFSFPYFGYLINFSKKKLGIIVIFIIPALFVIFEEIIKIRKIIQEKKTSQKEII